MRKTAEYKRYTRNKFGNVMYFIFLIAMGTFSVLPLIYCVCTAFKPLDELLVFPPTFFVRNPTLENFTQLPVLLESLRVPVSRYIFNSVFISVVATAAHIIVSSMAAFALAKSNIKLKGLIFAVIQMALLYNAYTLALPQ